ncbi:CID domain-containing protein [Pycnococcus provasolii]
MANSGGGGGEQLAQDQDQDQDPAGDDVVVMKNGVKSSGGSGGGGGSSHQQWSRTREFVKCLKTLKRPTETKLQTAAAMATQAHRKHYKEVVAILEKTFKKHAELRAGMLHLLEFIVKSTKEACKDAPEREPYSDRIGNILRTLFAQIITDGAEVTSGNGSETDEVRRARKCLKRWEKDSIFPVDNLAEAGAALNQLTTPGARAAAAAANEAAAAAAAAAPPPLDDLDEYGNNLEDSAGSGLEDVPPGSPPGMGRNDDAYNPFAAAAPRANHPNDYDRRRNDFDRRPNDYDRRRRSRSRSRSPPRRAAPAPAPGSRSPPRRSAPAPAPGGGGGKWRVDLDGPYLPRRSLSPPRRRDRSPPRRGGDWHGGRGGPPPPRRWHNEPPPQQQRKNWNRPFIPKQRNPPPS